METVTKKLLELRLRNRTLAPNLQMTCFCAFKRGTPTTLWLCSLPDPKDRLQECWDNWRFDQFATDNGFPVCRVHKMSHNEEPSNHHGFRLVTLRLFPRDIANRFSQEEKFRKTQKRRHWTQLRVFFKTISVHGTLTFKPSASLFMC